jgi:hypothetical protein
MWEGLEDFPAAFLWENGAETCGFDATSGKMF